MTHDEDEFLSPGALMTWKGALECFEILEESEKIAYGDSVFIDRIRGLIYHMHELICHGGGDE